MTSGRDPRLDPREGDAASPENDESFCMINSLRSLMKEPLPLRFSVLRWLDRRLDFLKYRTKLDLNAIERPHYGHCLLQAASLARTLGHRRISAIEFGVAGGNGLVALERHADYVRKETGVEVMTYGFDTGRGMPPPIDYRDMP